MCYKMVNLAPFSFDKWYPTFRKHSIRSVVIDLPADFVAYLHADGITLANNDQLYGYDETVNVEALDDDENGLDSAAEMTPDEDAAVSENGDAPEPPTFPELEARVDAAIAKLGGAVFPKLNWSSPRDAAWIALDGSLRCTTLRDIILLLKASDFAAFDLDQECERRVLVLRKWSKLHPGLEFRCWVSGKRIIAISQRDATKYYEFLAAEREELNLIIHEFFEDVIRNNFPHDQYVFDVYLTQSDAREPFLIDINPFDEVTDTHLFSWCELQALAAAAALNPPASSTSSVSPSSLPSNVELLEDGVIRLHIGRTAEAVEQLDSDEHDDDAGPEAELRLILSEGHVPSTTAPVFSAHRVPLDMVALSQGKSVAQFAAEWQQALADGLRETNDDGVSAE
ncbi:D123-domain-containing protein [Blastocladiella britannica]|nr:D123-domain-containing protein [Blastocladiella britannica]